MKKNILAISSLILIIAVVIINISTKNKVLNNVTIKSYLDGELLALMPTSNDNLKVSSVTCTNGTGKFNYSSWRLEVSTTSKTICTIYFTSNTNTNFNTYLKSKVCSSSVTSEEQAKDCLVNENGYRYEGSDPNNYVLFNDELWRIIGVFDVKPSGSSTTQPLVKLIRNDTLDALAWHGSGTNDWSVATLQSSLNNGYLNATDAECSVFSTSVTKTCKFSKSGIQSVARSKIQSVVWNLGGTSSFGTAEAMYTAERGTTGYSGRPTTWSGSVGLMYPSDYGYATYASTGCPRTTDLSSYNKTDCAGRNWLYKDGNQWTITPRSSTDSCVFNVSCIGYATYYSSASTRYGVRPSVYLKSSVKYMSGSGTYSDPYIIS